MNYNVSVNIFFKDYRIMSYIRKKVWTDRVITIGRVSAKTWRGPNYKVLKHTVLFGTHDIILNIHNA